MRAPQRDEVPIGEQCKVTVSLYRQSGTFSRTFHLSSIIETEYRGNLEGYPAQHRIIESAELEVLSV